MKLAFGIPWTSPFLWTEFMDSIMALQHPPVARSVLGVLEPLECRFVRGPGWCPARRHIAICEQALDWGADLICILGADQLYEPDLLARLVGRWNDGYEVVAALVPARAYIGWQSMKPFQRMAWRIRPANGNADAILRGEEPNQVDVIDPDAGPEIQPVNFIGSGVLMFHRDHLLALKQPWFYETFHPQTYERLASMDTGFVWRLQGEAGATVWVDRTIKVKHLTAMPVDETFAGRFDDWATVDAGPRSICQYQPFRDGATHASQV